MDFRVPWTEGIAVTLAGIHPQEHAWWTDWANWGLQHYLHPETAETSSALLRKGIILHSLKFMAAKGWEEATSINSLAYFLIIRDDKCSSHLANLFPNFKFCSMCINIFAAESQGTLPHKQVWWTRVPRRICLSTGKSGFQLWAAHSKSPAHREKLRDNRNTKTCFFRT